MKRLYFLVPDIDNATRIVNALKELGVLDEGMHVVIKDHEKLRVTKILEAGVLETTDFWRALVRGAVTGGLGGLLLGFILVKFPPEEFMLGGWTVVGLALFGILFGAWASSLIGISIPNPMVQKLEHAVEAGGIMMLVDIPKEKREMVLRFMKTYHPETTIHGKSVDLEKRKM